MPHATKLPAVIAAAVLISLAGPLRGDGPPATQPAAQATPPATQSEEVTPPEARKLLDFIEQLGVERMPNPQIPREVADFTIRVNEAAKALSELEKDFPKVARRPVVRRTELALYYAMAQIRGDADAKMLREAIAGILADKDAPRALKADASYYSLNADLMKQAMTTPAAGDGPPPWLDKEMDKRLAFAREYKDLEIGQQAWAETVILKVQLVGMEKAGPLVEEFMKAYEGKADLQATLLAQIAVQQYANDPAADWTKVKPLVDRLIKDYHDAPVTAEAMARLAEMRLEADPKAGEAFRTELTEKFAGNNAISHVWRQAAVTAWKDRDDKAQQKALADALGVLKEKFPTTEGRAVALAQLAMMTYDQEGLDAARPYLDTLTSEIPDAKVLQPLVEQLSLQLLNKEGYEKAGPFIKSVLDKHGKEDGKLALLRGIVRRHEAVGKPLELSFTSADGKQVDVSKMRGKVVVVYFWATWHAQCIAGMDRTIALARRMKDDVQFVGINLDHRKSDMLDFEAENVLPWASAFDGKGPESELATGWGIMTMPYFLVIDRKGNLVDAGVTDNEKLTKLLADLTGKKKDGDG